MASNVIEIVFAKETQATLARLGVFRVQELEEQLHEARQIAAGLLRVARAGMEGQRNGYYIRPYPPFVIALSALHPSVRAMVEVGVQAGD